MRQFDENHLPMGSVRSGESTVFGGFGSYFSILCISLCVNDCIVINSMVSD